MSVTAEKPSKPAARESRIAGLIHRARVENEGAVGLRVVQPALVGMIDGTVSSIAPIFAAAVSSNSPTAFVGGRSTALGAGISMGISEALSDTGESTGRGSPLVRGTITGGMTALGGIFHTLPFLISDTHRALLGAGWGGAVGFLGVPRGPRPSPRRGLRPGHGQGRRGVCDKRPGRDKFDHADLRRDDGLGAGRLHYGPGAHRAARHRRFPGGRHDRHN